VPLLSLRHSIQSLGVLGEIKISIKPIKFPPFDFALRVLLIAASSGPFSLETVFFFIKRETFCRSDDDDDGV
jgi:hypothetical protein